MQPNGSGTRAAVEAEGKRALARVADVILGIGDVEDGSLGGAVFELQEDGAGRRCVFDLLPADFQGMLSLNDFFLRSWRLFFFFWFFRSFVRSGLRRLLGKAQICSQKKQGGGTQKANWRLHRRRSSLSNLRKI